MLLLAAAHALPAREGRLRVVPARGVVAHHAAQQAVVGGGDARKVVHRHRRKARDIDLELHVVGDARRKAWIQTVNALDDQHRTVVELQRVVVPLALARDEIVTRHGKALAGEQALQMVVEEFQIDGFERFVVVFAVCVQRGLVAVDEVVVERDEHGFQSQNAELNAQTLGRGGLAARRRARDEHHARAARAIGLGDRVSDARKPFFMEGLGDLDQFRGVARKHLGVEPADGGHAHDVDPLLVLVEDVEELVLRHQRFERVGMAAAGQHDVKAVVVGADVEQVDVGCRRGERTVEIALHVAHRVETAVKARTGVQQLGLVVESQPRVLHRRVDRPYAAAGDRNRFVDEFLHAVADRFGLLRRDAVAPFDLAVEAAQHRVADVELALGVEFVDGSLENERGRAFIDADAFEMGGVDVTYGDRGVYLVVQFLDSVVDIGRQIGVRSFGKVLPLDFEQRRSHFDLDRSVEVVADDLDEIFHEVRGKRCVKIRISRAQCKFICNCRGGVSKAQPKYE